MTSLMRLFSIDLRSLAIFRIAIGSIVLFDAVHRLPDAALFYSDAGLLPRKLLFECIPNPWKFSAYFMNGMPAFATFLLVLTALSSLALLVGWKTRWATVLTWFLAVSLHVRNPLVNSSAEQLLRLLLLWSIPLPTGARFSIDALLSRKPAPAGSATGTWAAGLLLQPCLIYWVGALVKAGNYEWTHGRAIYCAVSIFEMGSPFGKWLAKFPEITAPLTHGVLVLEAVGPFLLFVPIFWVRMVMVASFLALQAGFGASLMLYIFPWTGATATLPFLPGEFWDRYFPGTRAEGPPEVRPRGFTRMIGQAAGAALIVYSLVWGFDRGHPRIDMPDRFRRLAWMLHAEQSWGMFVPPGRFHNWYVITGKTRDGDWVNVLHEDREVTLKKPSTNVGFFLNTYWQAYFSDLGIRTKRQRRLGAYAAAHLLERWNRTHPARERLEEVRIYRMRERFHPKPEPVRRTLLARYPQEKKR